MDENVRRWLPHALAVGMVVVELGVWAAVHRSDDEVRRAFADGTTQQRLTAMHVLANRGDVEPARLGARVVANLLAEPDDRMKEAAFTNEVCKFFVPPTAQSAYTYDLERFRGRELPHRWRSYVIHRRKVGGVSVGSGLRLQRRELELFLDAVEGRSLDREALVDYIHARIERTLRNAPR